MLCAQSLDYERMNPHPRLLLTQGGEEAVKRSITCFPSLLKVHERILKESDEILIQTNGGTSYGREAVAGCFPFGIKTDFLSFYMPIA